MSLASGGNTDGYLAVFEADGRLRWAQRIGGTGPDDARSIAADAAGNLYVSGSISRAATFGVGISARVVNAYGDAYVAKYSSTGSVAWVRIVGGPGAEAGLAVDVDGGGNVWLAGSTAWSWWLARRAVCCGRRPSVARRPIGCRLWHRLVACDR